MSDTFDETIEHILGLIRGVPGGSDYNGATTINNLAAASKYLTQSKVDSASANHLSAVTRDEYPSPDKNPVPEEEDSG